MTTQEPAGDDNVYLSLAAPAELLGVTQWDLRRRIRLGELATVRVGTQTLVRRAGLDRCLAPIQLAGGRTFDWRRLRE